MSKCAEPRLLVFLLLAACGSSPGKGAPAGGGQGGDEPGADAAGGNAGRRGDGGFVVDAALSLDQGPPDMASLEFCDPYAAKFCARLDACSSPYLISAYGTMKGCQERLTLQCRSEAGLPGTGVTPASVETCAQALDTAGCDDLLGLTVPACQFVGKLAKGGACGSGNQCQSGFCRTPETSFCGQCDVRAAEGAPCDASEACQFPLLCSEAGRCAPPALEGELCNESRPCKGGLQLYCGSDNTCRRRSAEGKACNRSGAAPLALCEVGLVCRPTANGTCRAIRWVDLGESCGVPQNGGTVILCAGSGSCVENICRPPGKDGDKCTASPLGDSGGCLPPALCLGGLCKLPDPSSCQ
jgi:hypothetical protein